MDSQTLIYLVLAVVVLAFFSSVRPLISSHTHLIPNQHIT